MTRYVIKAPIASITSDSRLVEKNSLFIAYPGQYSDGREYIADAIKKGAVAVVWDEDGFAWNPDWDREEYCHPTSKITGRAHCQSVL